MCQGTVNYNTTTTTVKVRRSYQSNVVQFYTKFDFFLVLIFNLFGMMMSFLDILHSSLRCHILSTFIENNKSVIKKYFESVRNGNAQ